MVSTYISQLRAGIDPIDDAWGGLYRGGSYLVYGPQGSGRSLLALAFTRCGYEQAESTLFISPRRPRDLRIQAAMLDFNLRAAYDSGLVRLMRIPPLLTLRDAGDDGIVQALQDFASILHAYRPARVIIDDFVPFVQFESFDRFSAAFLELLDKLDPLDTTLMLVMAEPASAASRQVVAFMRQHMTGIIHTAVSQPNGAHPSYQLHLTAMLGHPPQPIVAPWSPFGTDEPDERGASSGPAAEPKEVTADALADEAALLVRALPLGTTAALPSDSPSIRPIPLGQRTSRGASTPEAAAMRLETFRTRLQPYFQLRDGHGPPFLLIAIHLTPEGEQQLPFPTLVSLTRPLLQSADDLFADPEGRRIVVLLTDSTPGAEKRFFERMREQLIKTAPKHAEALIHRALITAAVPNGKPFEHADEFLTWALHDG